MYKNCNEFNNTTTSNNHTETMVLHHICEVHKDAEPAGEVDSINQVSESAEGYMITQT